MRAAVLRDFGSDLSIESLPDPGPEETGVVLRVLACGVCRSDFHGWKGEHPRVKPGAVLGHEYVGEVVAAGPRSDWTLGERLIAPFLLSCGACRSCRAGTSHVCEDLVFPGLGPLKGAFAEYIAVPRGHDLQRLPEGMAPETAAGLGCRVITAWHALTGEARLAPGEWLAIQGTGGVGLSLLLLGQALGARVIAVDPVAEKRELALRLGAEHAFAPEDAAVGIRDVTGGGAAVSVDAIGLGAAVDVSLAGLAPLGRHVQVGYPVGPEARMTIDMSAVYTKNLAIYGSRGMPAHRYPALLSLLTSGKVDLAPMLGRRIALSEVSAALSAMKGPTPPGVDVVTRFGE